MQVVGYSNRSNGYQRNWERSMAQANYNYQVIGQGEKWRGWVTRPRAYLKYLQAQPNDETVYVFLDVHDLAANPIPDAEWKYLTTFRAINRSIVLGTEPNCNPALCRPLIDYWEWENPIGPNLYLNWGLVSGYRNELIDLCQFLVDDYEANPTDWNEQIATSAYIDQHPELFHLDCKAKFIGNIICHPSSGNVGEYTCHDNQVYYQRYDCYPFFIHAPSSNIDAMARYDYYVGTMLGDQYEEAEDGLNLPGYHWVSIGLIILTVIILVIIWLAWDWLEPYTSIVAVVVAILLGVIILSSTSMTLYGRALYS